MGSDRRLTASKNACMSGSDNRDPGTGTRRQVAIDEEAVFAHVLGFTTTGRQRFNSAA